jgi:hypothetical protein
MNKQQKTFLGIWFVMFALYIVVALALKGRWLGLFESTDLTVTFALGATALVVLLICDMLALGRTGEKGLFLGMPLLVYSYGFTTAVAGMALRFISLPHVPLWAVVISYCAMMAGGIAASVGAHASASYIDETDAELAEATQAMRALIARASTLEAQTGKGPARKSVHAVAEAIRFSDPVSSAATAGMEANVQQGFERFRKAVLDGADSQMLEGAAAELLALIAERNELCRLSK